MDKQLSVSPNRRETLFGLLYWPVQIFPLPWLLGFTPLSAAWQNTIYYCVNFFAMAVIFRRLLKESADAAGRSLLPLVYTVFFGFCGYYSSSYFWSNLLLLFFPGFANINDAVIHVMLEEAGFVLAFCTVVMVPVSEELFFRGLIFGNLYGKKPVLAYALSAAAFCAAHVLAYVGIVPFPVLLGTFLQYVPAGLCLAWAYAKADNILAPILIHAIVNALGIFS